MSVLEKGELRQLKERRSSFSIPSQGPQVVGRLFPLATHDAMHCTHPLTESASARPYVDSPLQSTKTLMERNSPLMPSRNIARRGSIGSSGERRDSFAMDKEDLLQGIPLMNLNSNSRNSSPYRRSRSLSTGCMQINGLADEFSQKFDLIEAVRRHSMEWSSADTERYQAQFASAVRCATALPVEVTDLVFAYCYDPNNPPMDRLKFLADIDRLGLDEIENRPSPDITTHRRLSVSRLSRGDGEELPFIKESNNARICQDRQA